MSREFYEEPPVEYTDTKTGTAADSYGSAVAMDVLCSSYDIFIFDNAAIVKLSPDGTNYGDEFEIPKDSCFSKAATLHTFNIKNKTAGSNARYSVVGHY